VCAISTRETAEPTEGRVPRLIELLQEAHPDAACALRHQDPFQLLVATILSAQCTDERVNQVTPSLFARYPDPASLGAADPKTLESIIRSTGFFRNKAKSIRGAAGRIVSEYGGTVPSTMEDLLTLPGVARKTANVVLGVGYGQAEGIVVDTHVERLSHRLGLTNGKNASEVERDLMKIVPRDDWIRFSHLLIFHGRRVCTALRPHCSACAVQALCPSAPLFLSGRVPPREAARRARARAGRGAGGSRGNAAPAPRRARAASPAPKKRTVAPGRGRPRARAHAKPRGAKRR
jgi:endonuclease III